MQTVFFNDITLSLSSTFKIKCWEGQCVAYHVPTGNTHRLDHLSSSIVEFLGEMSPINLTSLCQKLKKQNKNRYTDDIVETYVRQLTIAEIIRQQSQPIQ